MPVAAVTWRGRPIVSSRSSTAQSAISGARLTASFTPPSQVMTEIGVASEPVPAWSGPAPAAAARPCDADAPDRRRDRRRSRADKRRAWRHPSGCRRRSRRPSAPGRAPAVDRRQQVSLRRIGLDRVEQMTSRRSLRAPRSKRRSGRSRATSRVGDEQARPGGQQLGKPPADACAGDQPGPGWKVKGRMRRSLSGSALRFQTEVAFEPAHQRARRACAPALRRHLPSSIRLTRA